LNVEVKMIVCDFPLSWGVLYDVGPWFYEPVEADFARPSTG